MRRVLIGRRREHERLHRSVRAGAGAVVVGALGVGKTHLVRTVLEELRAEGVPVLHIAATASTATVPFGAVADLLPPDHAAPEPAWLLRRIAANVARRGAGHAVVIGVDDAHLLDPASAAAIHHLAVTGVARVLATVRVGEPCPDAVVGLWKDHGADRLELAELEVGAARALAMHVLESPASDELWARLWQTAGANPLYLTELIRSGLESGAIRVVDGEAELVGNLAPAGRLADVVAGRLKRCSESARRLLEMLAVASPLPLAVVEAAFGAAVVCELEEAKLAVVQRDGLRVEISPTHPVVAETVRAITPVTTRRELARALVTALESEPLRRGLDRLHTCLLRLEAGLLEEPDRFLQAASEALDRFDAELAERLITPVLATADPVEARLLLGRSLRMRHRAAEAEAHLTAASRTATDDRQRARAALELAQTRLYERRRPAEAMHLLAQARASIEEPAWRHELDALAALFTTFTGDLSTAAELGDRVLEHPAPTRSVVNTLAVSTIAQVMLGRFGDAEQALDVARRLSVQAPPEASLAAELLAINDFSLDLFIGRVSASLRKARAGFARVRARGQLDVVGAWGSTLELVLLPAGQIAEAVTVGAEALAALQLSDPLGLLGGARAVHAYVVAHAGDPVEARRLVEHPSLDAAAQESRARYHRDRATVWLTAAEGRFDQAAVHALEGGSRALDSDLIVWGAMLLHDAVRLQRPGCVAPLLRPVADRVGGRLIPALADHAQALEAADGQAILTVAETFADTGATLLAAEAAAQGSALLQSAGHRDAARRAAVRAHELAGRCPGARTPALVLVPHPLTAREREVALMAVRGLSNRQVAGAVGVSKRTIDNHLASVYRKLGVSGRTELATVLQP